MSISCVDDPIRAMRAENRTEWEIQRKQNRDDFLKQKRVTLLEAEALVASITLQEFKNLCLKAKDKNVDIEILKAIKNNCCSSGRSEAFMKTENALNNMVCFLVGRDAALQLEAAACLANLVCGSHKSSHRVAKAAGAYLVSFLGSRSFYLQDQSAWACGNIANCCSMCFSLLKSQGLVPALLVNIQSPIPNVLRSTVFALNACTKYEDQDLRELCDEPTVIHLLRILDQKDIAESTWTNASFTLSNICFLSASNNMEIQASTIERILTQLEKLVFTENTNLLLALPLTRCLGFASVYESSSSVLARHPKFKKSVAQILACDCQCLVLEMLWVITNLAGYCSLLIKDVDLNKIFQNIDMKLSTNYLLQILYFLCCWASRNEKIRVLLQEEKYSSVIQDLSKSSEVSVKTGAKVLLQILSCSEISNTTIN